MNSPSDCRVNSTSTAWTACANGVNTCKIQFFGGALVNCGLKARHYTHVRYVCGTKQLDLYQSLNQ